jgi:hypothetical protein
VAVAQAGTGGNEEQSSNSETSGKVMTPKQQHDGLQKICMGWLSWLRDGLRAGEKNGENKSLLGKCRQAETEIGEKKTAAWAAGEESNTRMSFAGTEPRNQTAAR